MSPPINDGGPAFPVPPERTNMVGDTTHWGYAQPGMPLRDWLAGGCPLTPTEYASVYGMPLRHILMDPAHAGAFWRLYADERYAYADAMIKAKGGAK